MGNVWFGSKATTGLCQPIIAMMPPHSVYIETHLGGGTIMKRKPPALRNIGIDLDPRAIAHFACDYPVQLIEGHCHDFLRDFPFNGSELVYCDPPYLHHTRRSDHRYRHDYTDADHEELLAILISLSCPVMLSGYPSAFYDARLKNWGHVPLQVMNHAGVVTEKVWFNFAPGPVHWVKYAGRNFTHRQGIKRKAERWRRRYASMPPAERLAVLAAILQVEAEPPPCP